MKPKPSKRISVIRSKMKDDDDEKVERFFKYGVNDRNITSIIAYLDEQWELQQKDKQ